MDTPSRVAADGSSRPASSTNVGAKSTLPTCRDNDGAGSCTQQQVEAGLVPGGVPQAGQLHKGGRKVDIADLRMH